LDYDCHIWTGDAYKAYREARPLDRDAYTIEEFEKQIKTNSDFALRYGELGPIYGKQWRNWNEFSEPGWDSFKIDQIQNLINELKTNPDSRRLMVSAWNVGQLDEMVLPPCHYGFQVYTRELSEDDRLKYWTDSLGKSIHYANDFGHSELDTLKVPRRTISLMWNQRSVDTFLGLPFNIASYALLLEIIAKEVNMVPDELIGNLGDVHLYSNHIQQAKEQIRREPFELSSVQITERNWYQHEKVKEHLGEKTFNEKIMSYRPDCFELIDYQSHPSIKAPLSN
jgi:thymidylate synthase